VSQERLTLKFTIDVETTTPEFEDELLEIHVSEIVRRAIGHEIAASVCGSGIRLLGIFEGVDARLVRRSDV
jgi:hypothetical protein